MNKESVGYKMSEYKFNFAVSAEISLETIKEMIKASVEEQTGRKVKSVVFKIGMKYYGFGDESGSPELSGCTVHFE
jgi:trehalose-6-phosphate synthase